jgi:dihydrodipicolinate synthase/N-acetylneuraminate lyase
VQNYVGPIGTPVSAAVVANIVERVPNAAFVKEETAHAPQLMTEIRELAGDKVKGMMGGMAGRYLLEEVRRGACGTMPACEVTDAHVAVWNALENDPEEGRRLHGQLLPLLNYEAMYSFTVYRRFSSDGVSSRRRKREFLASESWIPRITASWTSSCVTSIPC